MNNSSIIHQSSVAILRFKNSRAASSLTPEFVHPEVRALDDADALSRGRVAFLGFGGAAEPWLGSMSSGGSTGGGGGV